MIYIMCGPPILSIIIDTISRESPDWPGRGSSHTGGQNGACGATKNDLLVAH